jgi:hypothetical protein
MLRRTVESGRTVEVTHYCTKAVALSGCTELGAHAMYVRRQLQQSRRGLGEKNQIGDHAREAASSPPRQDGDGAPRLFELL